MIVHETYAQCEGCGYRIRADEHPRSWPTVTHDDERFSYCSRDCLRASLNGATRPSAQERFGLKPIQVLVIEMVARGMCNKAIGREIGWAESTMKNQLSVLLKRFDVESRVALPVKAHQLGIIDIGLVDLEAH